MAGYDMPADDAALLDLLLERSKTFGLFGAVTMNFFWQHYREKEGLLN